MWVGFGRLCVMTRLQEERNMANLSDIRFEVKRMELLHIFSVARKEQKTIMGMVFVLWENSPRSSARVDFV
jgi:hypothetical protein